MQSSRFWSHPGHKGSPPDSRESGLNFDIIRLGLGKQGLEIAFGKDARHDYFAASRAHVLIDVGCDGQCGVVVGVDAGDAVRRFYVRA